MEKDTFVSPEGVVYHPIREHICGCELLGDARTCEEGCCTIGNIRMTAEEVYKMHLREIADRQKNENDK
jgi:hypothetical protein